MKLDVISFFKRCFPLHEEEMIEFETNIFKLGSQKNANYPKNPDPSKVVISRTQTHPCYTGSRWEGPVILRVVDHHSINHHFTIWKIRVIQTVFPNFM